MAKYNSRYLSSTEIVYHPFGQEEIEIDIYALSGQLVRRVAVTSQGTTPQRYSWNGLDNNGIAVGSGVYIVRVRSDLATKSTKVTLLR